MRSHEITHIRKHNRISSHEHITHVKYDGAVQTREYVISLIQQNTDSFYVKKDQKISFVGIVQQNPPRLAYLRTHADGVWNDNLLALPECYLP